MVQGSHTGMRRVPLPCRRLVWCLLLCCLPGCGEDPDNGEVQDGQSVQGCKSGSAAACDDGNDCTVDSCAKDGGCGHEPKSGSCQTGQPCTLGACVATTCANTGPATATTVVEDLLPWSVRRRPGGGLIAVGGLDTGLQWKLRVVALDLEGETIDAESRTVDALVRHCDFAPDGGIRCAGPGGPASVPLDKQHPQIGAWSADGEPLWQATLSNWPSDEHGCRRFAVAPDGGVFCGLDHPPKGPHQPLARLDHKGGVAWTHAIEEIALDQPPPLAPLDGGGVAMVGVPPDDWSAGVFKAIRVLSLGPKGDVMDADDVAVPQAAKAVSFLAMDRTTHGAVVVAVSDQVACAAG